MTNARRASIAISAAAAIFVFGTAILTRNPGLYLLGALSAASALSLLATKPGA